MGRGKGGRLTGVSSRSGSRIATVAIGVLVALSAACTDPGTPVAGTSLAPRAPRPTVKATGPTPTASPSGDPGTVAGKLDASPSPAASATAPPAIAAIALTLPQNTLYVPAPDPSAAAGLPGSTQALGLLTFADGRHAIAGASTSTLVAWSISPEAVATVSDGGVVSALTAGTATITLAAIASSSLVATASLTVDSAGNLGVTVE